MANKEYIERLQLAIFHLHKCDAKHVETAPVHETFQGETVWQGNVEVFDVTGHERAKRAYAWSFKDDSEQEHITAVLELPPVKTPLDAVRVSILADRKRAGKRS